VIVHIKNWKGGGAFMFSVLLGASRTESQSQTKREADSTSKPKGKIARELPNFSAQNRQKIEKKGLKDASLLLTYLLGCFSDNTTGCAGTSSTTISSGLASTVTLYMGVSGGSIH
jgi:hypothetical protein